MARFQDLLEAIEGIAYLLDRDGTIVAIGRHNWNRFAADNDGETLIDGAATIGRNLFDIIAGDRVRRSQRQYFDAVASGRHPAVVFTSRCDSPGVRRTLRLSMTPVHTDHASIQVLVQSATMNEDVRPPVDLFDFRAIRAQMARTQNLPILAMCSYCQKVRVPAGSAEGEGSWMSAADYYRAGGGGHVRISHTLCAACESDADAALAA